MSKKPAKRSTTAEKVSAVELAARREKQTLRRLRDQQRQIVALSRDLTRAVRKADGARLAAARELCEDTGYAVFGLAEIDQREAALAAAERNRRELLRRVEELQAVREPAGVS